MALYKRGKTWWIHFVTPSGERIRRSTGTQNKELAQQLHDQLKAESWRRDNLKEKARHTWDEAALQWLKEKGDKRSIKSDISMLRFLTPILRGKFLDEITRADIVRIGEDRKKNATPARANRYLALIRSILNRAMKVWEWLDKVPAITLYKEPKRRVRYLEPVEIKMLMSELPEHLKPVVAFALLTGLRRSNISNLKWSQINLSRGLIVIDGDQMKNGNTHSVQLSDMAKEIVLQQFGKHPEYVFTFKGNPVGDFHKGFNAALKRAGISDFRFHDLRHTWASLLVQSGVSLYELQEMGAWQSEQMVKRYAHLSSNKLRENANLIANVLDTALPMDDTKMTQIVLQ